jgi:hypothetical protein
MQAGGDDTAAETDSAEEEVRARHGLGHSDTGFYARALNGLCVW